MRTWTRSCIQRTCSRSTRTRLRTDTLAHTTRVQDETPGASIFRDARLRPPGPELQDYGGWDVLRGGADDLQPWRACCRPAAGPEQGPRHLKGEFNEVGVGGKRIDPWRRTFFPAARTTRHRASSGSTLNMKLPTNILRQICFHTFCLQYVSPGF